VRKLQFGHGLVVAMTSASDASSLLRCAATSEQVRPWWEPAPPAPHGCLQMRHSFLSHHGQETGAPAFPLPSAAALLVAVAVVTDGRAAANRSEAHAARATPANPTASGAGDGAGVSSGVAEMVDGTSVLGSPTSKTREHAAWGHHARRSAGMLSSSMTISTVRSSASPRGAVRRAGLPEVARGSGRMRQETAARRFSSFRPRRALQPLKGHGMPLAVMVSRSPLAWRAASVAHPTQVWWPQSPAMKVARADHSSLQMTHSIAYLNIHTRNENKCNCEPLTLVAAFERTEKEFTGAGLASETSLGASHCGQVAPFGPLR